MILSFIHIFNKIFIESLVCFSPDTSRSQDELVADKTGKEAGTGLKQAKKTVSKGNKGCE